jgi:hypothetical protein
MVARLFERDAIASSAATVSDASDADSDWEWLLGGDRTTVAEVYR